VSLQADSSFFEDNLYRYRLFAEKSAWLEFGQSPSMPALFRGLLKF
jgi:hypothetical protein